VDTGAEVTLFGRGVGCVGKGLDATFGVVVDSVVSVAVRGVFVAGRFSSEEFFRVIVRGVFDVLSMILFAEFVSGISVARVFVPDVCVSES
jgi:hypothetical protein